MAAPRIPVDLRGVLLARSRAETPLRELISFELDLGRVVHKQMWLLGRSDGLGKRKIRFGTGYARVVRTWFGFREADQVVAQSATDIGRLGHVV